MLTAREQQRQKVFEAATLLRHAEEFLQGQLWRYQADLLTGKGLEAHEQLNRQLALAVVEARALVVKEQKVLDAMPAPSRRM